MIDKKTVQSIAHLARLEFAPEEEGKFTQQMGAILEYVEKLNELDTNDIEAMSHVEDIATPMRNDEVVSSSVIETVLEKDAPDHEENFFRVPKVL